jgi:hypothetical protein
MEHLKLLGLDKVSYNDGNWTPLHQRLLNAGYLVSKDGTYVRWSPIIDVKEGQDVEKLAASLNTIGFSDS